MGDPMTQRPRKVLELVDVPAAAGTVDDAAAPSGPEPFESFYRREWPRLLVLARALAGVAAEDVAQEAMLVAYRRWDTIARLASPTGYIRRTCLHKAVSVARRQGLERRMLPVVFWRTSPPPEAPAEDAGAFWSEVQRLPLRQAQAVALYYALDLPMAEVAATLGCAEGTAKVHLHRARAALALRLGAAQEEPS